ncbi:hypothetical protein WJX74_003576 [Apatococcus lobatus]|uniref:Uncharacterized protein n=1 Tax=Apatococcus lobatus TaxID=904363 RepID=A0AAW1RJI1_9CHLO
MCGGLGAMRGLAKANDAAESAPLHVRGNAGQCAIECLLPGNWKGRVGHSNCNWCGAQDLPGAAINLLPFNL